MWYFALASASRVAISYVEHATVGTTSFTTRGLHIHPEDIDRISKDVDLHRDLREVGLETSGPRRAMERLRIRCDKRKARGVKKGAERRGLPRHRLGGVEAVQVLSMPSWLPLSIEVALDERLDAHDPVAPLVNRTMNRRTGQAHGYGGAWRAAVVKRIVQNAWVRGKGVPSARLVRCRRKDCCPSNTRDPSIRWKRYDRAFGTDKHGCLEAQVENCNTRIQSTLVNHEVFFASHTAGPSLSLHTSSHSKLAKNCKHVVRWLDCPNTSPWYQS